MKTSRFMRAALPLLAIVGFASYSSNADAIAGGKRIFDYVQMTTDLTPGYAHDTFEINSTCHRDFKFPDGTTSGEYVQDEVVHTQRDMSHIRSVTLFEAYEGPLTNAFMEIASGFETSTSERTRYENELNLGETASTFGFLANTKHAFMRDGTAKTAHRKARGGYNAHILFGYDLSKTTRGNKSATFKPYFGYFIHHTRTSRQSVDGKFLENSAPPAILVPTRAHVESRLHWQGFMLGLMTDVRWLNNSVFLRGDVRFSRTRMHKLTTEMDATTTPGYRLMHPRVMKMARDKRFATWRLLGYSGTFGYKRHIGSDWTLFSEMSFMRMSDKRYSDRVFVDRGRGTLTDRIEKIWHIRTSGHAGVSYHY